MCFLVFPSGLVGHVYVDRPGRLGIQTSAPRCVTRCRWQDKTASTFPGLIVRSASGAVTRFLVHVSFRSELRLCIAAFARRYIIEG